MGIFDFFSNHSGDTSANAQAVLLHSEQENFLKETDNCNVKISQPVRRSKRNKGTSISEATDQNTRKTRRKI
ncbi:hypothetical protein OROHE_018576 [Orobanche hederae]